MTWTVEFFNKAVEDDILDMPPKIQARMIKLLELIEKHGANLGSPHTEPMGNGLFEIRAKAKEGIGRSLYCYMKGRHIVVLHAFIKRALKHQSQISNWLRNEKGRLKSDEHSTIKRQSISQSSC